MINSQANLDLICVFCRTMILSFHYHCHYLVLGLAFLRVEDAQLQLDDVLGQLGRVEVRVDQLHLYALFFLEEIHLQQRLNCEPRNQALIGRK